MSSERAAGTVQLPSRADPITTEVVRHGLNSAAEQMKRTLIRTSFSPVIYEVLDFAVAIYDRRSRLLAQAPSNPLFMGTLGFCVDAAVAAVGGEAEVDDGDIILINIPYASGTHQQDAGVVMPVFVDGQLIGYVAIKAHWLDLGAKEPYSTDTVDVFQEGIIFPGVKLYERGVRVDAIYRMALANSRMPEMVAGDINAEVAATRTGAVAVERIVRKHGHSTFWESVEQMFDHGEAVMRERIASMPDGKYVAQGLLDNDGISGEHVPFEIAVVVEGSDVTIDFSSSPGVTKGPMNCPLPQTVSASRAAIAMLAGPHEPPNEGHFRPLTVKTVPGTLFHPESPAPTYLNGWTAMQTIDVIHRAFADAIPSAVPAGSGGCICGAVWWGERESAELWSDSTGHPIGQGAHPGGDGAHSLMHLGEAASRFASAEVFEARYPLRWEKMELAPDSCGAGTFAGGLGVDSRVTALEDAFLTCVIERTTLAPWGLAGGTAGRANKAVLQYSDGREEFCPKVTALFVEKGATLVIETGGGGGYGPPNARNPAAVLSDLENGHITRAYAQRHYTQALKPGGLA
jgi:N-methylhydantoinase B